MGVVFTVYMIGKSKPVDKLFHSRLCGKVLISIGPLCLDSYLIQKALITDRSDRFNSIFPADFIIDLLAVILAAYIVKVLSNFISQVFSSEPMNWSSLLKTY